MLALMVIWRKSNAPANQYVTFSESLGPRSNFVYSDLENEANERDRTAEYSIAQSQQQQHMPPGNANNNNHLRQRDEFVNQAFDLQENRLSQQSNANGNVAFENFANFSNSRDNKESNV